jgi:hypothetical protein
MDRLNLPEYTFRFKENSDKRLIFDPLRKRFVTLTPEEWVRQNMSCYLTSEKGFPASLMVHELSLRANGMMRRCDLVVYGRDGQALMIAEYKAPGVEINQQTFDQIARYNFTFRVGYLLISNGLQHYCCKIDYDSMQMSFLRDIPSYGELQ